MFGEWGCVPLIAFGKLRPSSAFKMLARVKDIPFDVANEVSKQLQRYETELKNKSSDDGDDNEQSVDIEKFIDRQHIGLVEDSKKYRGIYVSVAPHPCAHITYHHDMREDVGVIRLKNKETGKPMYCLFMDGTRADMLNYVKSDLLRVDVVKLIHDSFKAAGLDVIPVETLLKAVENDEKVWYLYEKGYCQGLNQVEKEGTMAKCMQFKPKNAVELACLIAAIRPGFKSKIQEFVTRTPSVYDVPILNELLKIDGTTGATARSAFLMFDEQILRVLIAGGIPAAKAYATIKYIKKKKADKVLQVKEEFRAGFTKYLIEQQNATKEVANKTVDDIWKIIEDSSNYLFCAAHAFAMACDSLYGAWLKAHYPYEFYLTMLEHYTAKKDIDKISAIIAEMRAYLGVILEPPTLGVDNSKWYVDREAKKIYPALSFVKNISAGSARALMKISPDNYDYFCELLYYIMMNTTIDSRQIETLIKIGYFRKYGTIDKLMYVQNEFRNGNSRITKTTKSWQQRLESLKEDEGDYVGFGVDAARRAAYENDLMGLCVSVDEKLTRRYVVTDIDDKYGIKIKLYNVSTGKYSPYIKMRKVMYEVVQPKVGDVLDINPLYDCSKKNKRAFVGEKMVATGEIEYWFEQYKVA